MSGNPHSALWRRLRHHYAVTENKQPLSDTPGTRATDERFTSRAGFGYLFDNGVTPYASYSESFLPQSGTDSPVLTSTPVRSSQPSGLQPCDLYLASVGGWRTAPRTRATRPA